ncbi:MAG: PLP-dependent transferase, partial [Oscillospiraceae bacterium]|nr:PLP-dependent transferase [Oscillospiraceae bacterium]
ACIYITSPDYLGNLQDIAGLAEICKKYQAKLLVDNAHGAHLAFLKQNQHPIALGADMCCDSAHKTLPALTGGAFLHMKNPDNLNLLKQHMQMFGSTSPSYLIMQSLETCTEWLANQGKQAIQICAERAEQLKQKLAEKYSIIGNDSMHLTLQVNGVIMADIFRKKYKIECEYADKTCLVFLLSPMMTQEDFARLEFACMNCEIIPAEPIPELPLPLEQVYSMRESALVPWELINLEQAEGRICAPVQVPCPPAVPIVISGERLNKNWLNIMKFYDLEKIAVMQK